MLVDALASIELKVLCVKVLDALGQLAFGNVSHVGLKIKQPSLIPD